MLKILAPVAALAVLLAPAARADVPIPPIPATHPRVLLVGAELQRLRDDLATQRPAMKRFKEQMVDLQLAGADIYAYEAWYSAMMGVVTQQPQYCTHAVQMTDAFLDAEALRIRNGETPEARYDSYLYIGDIVGSLSLVYDWCHANLSATQKLRWGNYADRWTENVWNQDTHNWGEPTAANNYSWDGPVKPAGSGWSIDNPVNNYYYSFLRATMLWGVVSKGEPGRTKSDGLLQRFRNEKIGNQLVPVFNAQLMGGGSREGTGYGTAMRGLFGLYHLWEKTTGERIADLTTHAESTMPYMIHAIAPTRDKLAPIGDHARDETAAFYDYHRDMLLALSSLFRGTPMARSTRDFLALSSRPQMGDRFNWVYDVLYDGAEASAPAAMNTSYFASGTGQFYTRSSWNTNATWLSFLTGAYTESHAHPDGLSILLYKNGWLVNDANMTSRSGIQNVLEAHGLVTQRRVSNNQLLPMYSYEASTNPVRPESSAKLRAMAVKGPYTYVSSDSGTLYVHPSNGDQGVRASREIVYVKPDTVIVFDRAEWTGGGTVKTFQLPTPGLPSIAGRTATYGNGTSTLKVHAVSPTNSILAVTDMRTVDTDFQAGYRIDASVTGSGVSQFLHVLGIDNSVAAAVRGANDGAATVTLADGRTVTVAFSLLTPGGSIEIRNAQNQVVVSEALPSTIAVPPVFVPMPGGPDADADNDGVPNAVEVNEGIDPQVKDNDVFTSARWFAMQQYRDFLGREGDAGGIAFQTQSLASGTSTRRQLVSNFLASPEFQNGLPQMTRLYFAFFNRIPDYAGLMFQANAYRSGAPIAAIAQNFSLSPEFQATYGALSDEQYVDLVYQNVLGRAPDAGGRQYYLDRLGDGRLTRGAMMVGFSESPEFKGLVDNEVYVISVYVGTLRRAPEQAGLDFYVQSLENATSTREAMLDGFLNSPEYRARFLP